VDAKQRLQPEIAGWLQTGKFGCDHPRSRRRLGVGHPSAIVQLLQRLMGELPLIEKGGDGTHARPKAAI